MNTTSRDQFERTSKYMVQLQTTSKMQSDDKRTPKLAPKHDHGQFCYDELGRKIKQLKHENVI